MKNTLYTGDCLYVMNGINSNSVDMIYLDPPFNSKRMFSAPVGSKAAGSSFNDMWKWQDVDEEYLESLISDYPYLVHFIQSIGHIHGKAMMSYITYMTQRIIEMKRILKKDGSFYLHCDSTASHYLKVVCDRIFGHNYFRNEITWKRTFAHGLSSKHFPKISDKILFYSSKNHTWNPQFRPHDEDYIKNNYKKEDKYGKYCTQPLTGGKSGGKDAYKTWKNALPSSGRAWAPPKKTSFPKEINLPNDYEEKSVLEKLDILDDLNLVVWTKNNVPRYKMYLSISKGKPVTDIFEDIPPISAASKEKTGYPTQKPLILLRRLISSSTNENDVVLDPFCGCATTCVAAQQLGRKWIGIDLSETSAKVILNRLGDDAGLFSNFVHLKKFPKRTDVENEKINSSLKEKIFKDQKGKCKACSTEMEIRHFEIDHIIPKSKNGGDYYENFQLLCGSCNRIKGDRPMEYLNMRISEMNKILKYKVSFE